MEADKGCRTTSALSPSSWFVLINLTSERGLAVSLQHWGQIKPSRIVVIYDGESGNWMNEIDRSLR